VAHYPRMTPLATRLCTADHNLNSKIKILERWCEVILPSRLVAVKQNVRQNFVHCIHDKNWSRCHEAPDPRMQTLLRSLVHSEIQSKKSISRKTCWRSHSRCFLCRMIVQQFSEKMSILPHLWQE